MPPNHTQEIVHSSAMDPQNLNADRKSNEKLLMIKSVKGFNTYKLSSHGRLTFPVLVCEP